MPFQHTREWDGVRVEEQEQYPVMSTDDDDDDDDDGDDDDDNDWQGAGRTKDCQRILLLSWCPVRELFLFRSGFAARRFQKAPFLH